MPKDRADDANHLVRSFGSLRDAVHAYIHNINVGRAYKQLRALRAQMRSNGEALDPMRLAEGLSQYSERGEAYVNDIRQMMRSNHWWDWPRCTWENSRETFSKAGARVLRGWERPGPTSRLTHGKEWPRS